MFGPRGYTFLVAPEKQSFPDPEREHRTQIPAGAPAAPQVPAWLRNGAFVAGLALMGYLGVADTSHLFRAPPEPAPGVEPIIDPFPGEVRATAELVSPFDKPGPSSLGMLKTGPEEKGIDFTQSELSIAPDPAEPPMAPDGTFGVSAPKAAAAPVRGETIDVLAPGAKTLPDRPRLRPFESGASSRVRSWQAPPPGEAGEEQGTQTSAFYQRPADLPAPGASPASGQTVAPAPRAPLRSPLRAHAGGRSSGPTVYAKNQGQLPGAAPAGPAGPMDPLLAQLNSAIAGLAGASRQGQNQQSFINLRVGAEVQVRYRCPNGYWLNSIARTCCPKKEFCERRDPRGTCTQQAEGGLGR